LGGDRERYQQQRPTKSETENQRACHVCVCQDLAVDLDTSLVRAFQNNFRLFADVIEVDPEFCVTAQQAEHFYMPCGSTRAAVAGAPSRSGGSLA
jgi:hypothetical protein